MSLNAPSHEHPEDSVSSVVLRGRLANAARSALAPYLPASILQSVWMDCEDFIQRIVETYEFEVSRGEVGDGGTGFADGQLLDVGEAERTALCMFVPRAFDATVTCLIAHVLDNHFHVVGIVERPGTGSTPTHGGFMLPGETERFPTVFLDARADAPLASDEVEELCRRYPHSIYVFLCGQR